MSFPAPLSARLSHLRNYVGSLAWDSAVQVCRYAVLTLLRNIEIGRLELDEEVAAEEAGDRDSNSRGSMPKTSLRIHKDAFWLRVALFADMGFAESYMLGEVSCPDLTAFFKLFILNRTRLSNGQTPTSSLLTTLTGLLRRANTLATARLNVAAHYDISNAMFAAFLSPDLTYSCPIWLPISDPKAPHDTLAAAQARKLDAFVARAHIKPDDHVLEIGAGWGSFAIHAARATGCRVTGLTLSAEQKALAEARVAEAGLTDRIEILLCDYRALPMPRDEAGRERRYDKIVSIEMLEAVGKEFLETYFRCVERMLKKEGGIAAFQCITMPETRYDAYTKSDDFIRKYIFPGGHLPTVTQLIASAHAGSGGRLIVDSLDNIGPHYAKTLRVWGDNFAGNFDGVIKPALLREHEGMTEGDVQLFRRKWEYYFTYCEAGFATKTLGDVIFTVGREGAVEMAEDVPM
ncbi:cyclopropane-fatty-acyl-phospholipid synthase [Lineolata rhizophorae]|uniref:Cyclopropane-fatty-acyl-phospholipid synthase n=1 Tax=Lineolata rhizophorae TaxID=578093 RepID=A0A6A6P5K6_9PEZI|nr:cyclopropane-fatty-acyl-phospholipid synthase [Lineolata rhizophorae]